MADSTAPKLPTLAELSQQAKNGDAYAKNAVASWSGGGAVDPNEWVFDQGSFQKSEDYLNDFEKRMLGHNHESYTFKTGGDAGPAAPPTPPQPGGGSTGPGGGSLGGLRSMAMGQGGQGSGGQGSGGGMAGLGALFGGAGAVGGVSGPSGDSSTALETAPPMALGSMPQAGSNPASAQMIAGPGAIRPLGQRNPPSLDALLKVRAY